MKTAVYSWRLSESLKEELEREARSRNLSISAVLDMAVREWLQGAGEPQGDTDEQRRLHQSAARFIGSIRGNDPNRSTNVRHLVRKRLTQRRES
jgi:hypothetical protein